MALPEPPDEVVRPLAGLDRIVHEPARLMVLMYLFSVESADFVFLLRATGLTWGNLSAHLATLEEAGYVQIEKGFVSRKPRTMIRLTPAGRAAFEGYGRTMRRALEAFRG